MAADLSYGPAHLPGAASTGSHSQTLQIANVALNNKWTKPCSLVISSSRQSQQLHDSGFAHNAGDVFFLYDHKPAPTH